MLERTGHTEAAVDLARLAGLTPTGVICQIMNDDGTMARRNDLITFAQRHGLKIGTIADLIAYRRRYDLIVAAAGARPRSRASTAAIFAAPSTSTGDAGAAYRAGEGRPGEPGAVTVRMHAVNIFTDALGQRDTGRGGEVEASMKLIAEEGRGVVVVLIREPLTVMLAEQRRRAGEPIEPSGGELRDYGVGAQILIDLGVKEMVLLSNSRKSVVGLRGLRPQDRRTEAGSGRAAR